jgi:hypothetical protein
VRKSARSNVTALTVASHRPIGAGGSRRAPQHVNLPQQTLELVPTPENAAQLLSLTLETIARTSHERKGRRSLTPNQVRLASLSLDSLIRVVLRRSSFGPRPRLSGTIPTRLQIFRTKSAVVEIAIWIQAVLTPLFDHNGRRGHCGVHFFGGFGTESRHHMQVNTRPPFTVFHRALCDT